MKKITDLTLEDLKPYFTKDELCLYEIVNNSNGIFVHESLMYAMVTIPNMILHHKKITNTLHFASRYRISGCFRDRVCIDTFFKIKEV